MMGLRLGKNPQVVVTTTPRPTPLVRELIASPGWIVTRGTTYDNRENLARKFFDKVITKYEGTRLGRQELNAELLDDNPRALWQRDNIDRFRCNVAPTLSRVVVGLDPNVKNRDRVELAKSSDILDEAGVVVAGTAYVDNKQHFFVLGDYSLDEGPNVWGGAAVKAYRDHSADRIVGEVNNGGDMVEATIRNVDQNVSYKSVTASRGKAIRAEPIAALYEQGRVHHVGSFPKLEDEMCDFDPITTTKSPNRMDALVWALTELSADDSTGMLEFMRGQASAVQPVAPKYPTPTIVTGWPG
jgi:phage terminase large subunit-like protein